MQQIKSIEYIQNKLDEYVKKKLFLHLETTNGAYANHRNDKVMTVGAFIRNGEIEYSQAKITGFGPYRVGLKLSNGWVYAEGLTDWEIDQKGRLLLAGHDQQGKLAISLQLSEEPFE